MVKAKRVDASNRAAFGADEFRQHLRHYAWAWVALVGGLVLLSGMHNPHSLRHLVRALALLFALYALERLARYRRAVHNRPLSEEGTCNRTSPRYQLSRTVLSPRRSR